MSEVADKKFKEKSLKILEDKGVPIKIVDEVKKYMFDEELTKKQVQFFIDKVYIDFEKSLVTPGEPIGTVAAQSIGEPGTQMSVAGNERAIISISGIPQVKRIGTIIDDFLRIFNDNVIKRGDSEILEIPEDLDIKVPSLNDQEKIEWSNVRQFSRHSPNGRLLQIETRTGRKILATKSHSFVIRRNNKIVPIKGDSLSVGDRIPIVKKFDVKAECKELVLEEILAPTKYWYGSELEKAKELYSTAGRDWISHHNIMYKSPVKADAMRLLLKGDTMTEIKNGFVYPTDIQISNVLIPETLTLDEIFGYFIGEYLSEGTSAPSYISIANNDPKFIEKIYKFADRFKIGIHKREKDGEFGIRISHVLSSSLLSDLVTKLCGKGADHKFIDSHLLFSNKIASAALLRGYFDGDGSISVNREMIRAGSNSKQLIEDIALMLSRFRIYSEISRDKKQWLLTIPKQYIREYAEEIGFNIEKKQSALLRLVKNIHEDEKYKTTSDSADMIPGFGLLLKKITKKLEITKSNDERLCVSIRKWTRKQIISRRRLTKLIELFQETAKEKDKDISEELQPLINAVSGDTLWDKIISIKELNSPTEYVYDFSVRNNENFLLSSGIITHNTLRTFHYAGVSEFSVTQGLPRLIEIVDARKNPSTPIMYVYLEEEYAKDLEKARKIHQKIEQIRVDSIAFDVELDLTEYAIVVYLDPELLEDKGIELDLIKKKLKKYKKKGDIDVDYDDCVIIINPEIDDIQKLQKMREKILKRTISGLKGVKRGIISKDETTGEWTIQCEGTNLAGVLKVKGVDKTRTISNHIHEVNKILGVEAARSLIIREAQQVLDDQGLDVDKRHLLALAELMCHKGKVLQIGRHGISGVKKSILARAAFEVTIKQLLNASISGEEEQLKGIPENVIIGQLVPTI
ncbi:MAG: DNA-directed RNA polymerase subunit A'', partial [Candidatus Lokiarchaeota archaeon]|nr:DNA-directed RNA polymerase subunit A'' [Candidatus Lokiarchaeota archaeon]